MKRATSILLVFVMLLSLMIPTAFAAEAESYDGKTVILYTGNVRGDVDIYAQIAAAKGDYEAKATLCRAKPPPTLTGARASTR